MGLAAGLLLGAGSGFAAQSKTDKAAKADSKDKKTEEVVVSGTPAAGTEASGALASGGRSCGGLCYRGVGDGGGQAIAYKAVAGTITVAGTDAEDAELGLDVASGWPIRGDKIPDKEKPEEAPATARMFYTAKTTSSRTR